MLLNQIEGLCRTSRRDLLLVAPFAKLAIVSKLLEQVPVGVDVTVVTRWWPEEIASGVSDIEIWHLFPGHPRRRLLLRHDLHAKLYGADDDCLIGSANLTSKALGLSRAPNLELLVAVPRQSAPILQFERALFEGTVEVDEDLYQSTLALVQALPRRVLPESPAALSLGASLEALSTWTPVSRQPEDLEVAYQSRHELLSSSASEAALSDLGVLQVHIGLDSTEFRAAVGARMLCIPMFAAVDRFVSSHERRFGEVREFLLKRAPAIDASRTWQTMFRWMIHFQPGRYRYRRPNHSELISRANGDS